MLVLINGITGNIGHATAYALLKRGHRVRGLGRSPEKLDPALAPQLESFVQASSWYDTAAHDEAFSGGVDAFINAAGAWPVLLLDAQLLLLRAAERANVRIFVPSSWCYDFTKLDLEHHESYDHLIMFRRQAALSSSIKPIYIFTGVLAEFWFHVPFKNLYPTKGKRPAWNPQEGSAVYFGDGKTRHQFTTFEDAGAYTAELVLRPGAEEGGVFRVMSFGADVFEMRDAYREVTGQEVTLTSGGSVENLERSAMAARAKGQPSNYLEYVRILYVWHTVEGKWLMDEQNLFTSPNVEPTSMISFLEQNKAVFKNWPETKQ